MDEAKMKVVFTAKDDASATSEKILKKMSDIASESDKVSARVSALGASFAGLAGAVSIAALSNLAKEFAQAGMAIERLRNGFEAAAGSATAGTTALAFARGEAARLGLDMQGASDAFLKLTAAARGTALEGAKTQVIFSAVAGASRALGLSTDQMNGSLLAISQMMSKGTIQSEELRGQLSERLPGAFGIAAKAMGVSTAELGKMLEQGQVIADDFLPKFAVELQKTFPVGEKAVSSLAAETSRLSTAMFDLKTAVMDTGGERLFSGVVKGITGAANEMGLFIKTLDSAATKIGVVLFPGVTYLGSIMSGYKDAQKTLPPLTAPDTEYLNLLNANYFRAETDWLSKNKPIKVPFLGQPQISADSFVVRDRNIQLGDVDKVTLPH